MIASARAAASAAGATALVLYGDGGVPAGALGARRPRDAPDRRRSRASRARSPPGRSLHGRRGHRHVRDGGDATNNPETGFDRGLLVHRPGLRRLRQARPRRAGRGITSSSPGGDYMAYSGTSVAAAQVAGAAALVRQAHPDWSPRRRARGARRHGARGRRRGGRRARARRGAGRRRVNVAAASDGDRRRRARLALVRPRARAAGQRQARAHAREHGQRVVARLGLARPRRRRDDGSSVSLEGAPSKLAIAPGATLPIPLTLNARGLPTRRP